MLVVFWVVVVVAVQLPPPLFIMEEDMADGAQRIPPVPLHLLLLLDVLEQMAGPEEVGAAVQLKAAVAVEQVYMV
jgi:hypothetical protein